MTVIYDYIYSFCPSWNTPSFIITFVHNKNNTSENYWKFPKVNVLKILAQSTYVYMYIYINVDVGLNCIERKTDLFAWLTEMRKRRRYTGENVYSDRNNNEHDNNNHLYHSRTLIVLFIASCVCIMCRLVL